MYSIGDPVLGALITATGAIIVALISLFMNFNLSRRNKRLAKEIEVIKSKHQRANFSHQLQFQKEFEVYQELWRNIVTFTDCMFEIVELDRTNSIVNIEEKIRQLLQLHETHRDFIVYHSPFFAKEIYMELEKLGFDLEKKEIFHNKEFKFNKQAKLFDKHSEVTKEIIDFKTNVSQKIRERITITE
ncbi:MAG: hypothetical protein MUC87_03525 [Bacteroidia bacterium]|jgi:hypothetical protein|nr:hypothetical protein [Bacteroidia bacterium]